MCSLQRNLLHQKHNLFVFLSCLLGQTGHLFLLESGGLRGVVTVVVLVGVEAGQAEEDADADSLCVADDVDGVLGELCNCLTTATASGCRGTRSLRSRCGLTREFPSSSRNIQGSGMKINGSNQGS